MYFIYSLLLGLGFLILLPRFLLDAFRHGKYVAGFRERLGSLSPISKDGHPVVWIHCVSVGETLAARPLIHAIKKQFPQTLIAVSTITRTGQNLAREVFKHDAAKVFYFPFDWRWVVRRSMKAINPDTVLIMETELWPGFLRECRQQQIPVALVNGRLSAQSFRRYRLIKSFITRVLGALDLAIMQTEADADRLRDLGMDAKKTFVFGSMKFDAGAMPDSDSLTAEFRSRFGLTANFSLILAASTHPPEEKILLDALKQLRAKEPRPRLMIAPRHPERFGEAAAMVERSGFSYARRTNPADVADAQAEVILLDSIGELPSVYSLATIVFVGGSIAKTGGHNVLEPAAVGACVITGAHTYNFHSIVESFVAAEALIQLPPLPDSEITDALTETISRLLAEPSKRLELGACARSLVNENRGATERTLQALNSLLATPATVSKNVGQFRAGGAPIA
ncbi:MAG TPA: 3-deoxy-D-manno-octulosonic acid transferase [Pyrinomonadaceae bacterium]|jgi:3-deoxy-D-manno-octulosonic-acid transferase|nr:3-deoxy-D-manno-octulosonic acid transferase [Pyrinomonadaceae bacterium]